MLSLRQRARCIGLAEDFSVVHDFFGYKTLPISLSLRTQLERLAWHRIDLNIIRVGVDQMAVNDIKEIDIAIHGTRDLLAQVQLAIGRVYHWDISTADASGAENINNDDEAEALCDDWSVDNDALDVFFVLTYAGDTIGRSAVDGPCDKDNSKGMEGSVVAIEEAPTVTPYILAHEVSHYLGLEHVANSNQLMYRSYPNGGVLTASEGVKMRDHCFVKGGC